jgi:inward rectifier potassium channel
MAGLAQTAPGATGDSAAPREAGDMAENTAPRTRMRTIQRGGRALEVVGGRRGGLTDLYHTVLRIPLWGLLLALAAVYVGLNLVFAGLYLLDPHGVTGLRPGDFLGAVFFSVQTISTVGYGVMAPSSLYANLVVMLECFVSLLLVAVTTGVVFAHVSKPTARVLFSKVATITLFDGLPHLMFRAINERSNMILEAEVMLNLARQVITAEGRTWRRFQDLEVTRRRSPLFALSWTIMHPLDESSPLFGASPESLAGEDAEIVVVISGVDDTFAQRIHARHAYAASDIIWDKEFENVLSVEPDGRWVLDYRKFHDVRDAATTAPH